MNRVLQPFNLSLDTLTARKAETARIDVLRQRGHFDKPVYPLLPGMTDFSIEPMTRLADQYRSELQALMSGQCLPSGYDPKNSFFRSPDAEILYLMIRSFRPKKFIEIGSGNSTQVVRQAIHDGKLDMEHIAIDPAPRSDVMGLVDKMMLSRFEELEDITVDSLIGTLSENDILFIDSSHEVRIGNDVAKIFCHVLPSLPHGVVVHVHDIFLPFDYQEPFPSDCPGWGEQYLLQAFLACGQHTLIWPGFFLQKMRQEDYSRLGFSQTELAQSFWFRVGV